MGRKEQQMKEVQANPANGLPPAGGESPEGNGPLSEGLKPQREEYGQSFNPANPIPNGGVRKFPSDGPDGTGVPTGEKMPEISERDGIFRWDDRAYAGFWIRFCAYLFDLFVIGCLKRMTITPLSYLFDWKSSSVFSPETIGSGFLFFAYFILLTRFYGQTLGKMVFGIRVISLKGDPLTWGVVLFRELVGRYINTALKMLTYPVIAFTSRKQGIHDLIADTAVVHENYKLKEPVVHG
jgi:RDD family.